MVRTMSTAAANATSFVVDDRTEVRETGPMGYAWRDAQIPDKLCRLNRDLSQTTGIGLDVHGRVREKEKLTVGGTRA